MGGSGRGSPGFKVKSLPEGKSASISVHCNSVGVQSLMDGTALISGKQTISLFN